MFRGAQPNFVLAQVDRVHLEAIVVEVIFLAKVHELQTVDVEAKGKQKT